MVMTLRSPVGGGQLSRQLQLYETSGKAGDGRTQREFFRNQAGLCVEEGFGQGNARRARAEGRKSQATLDW